jgi:hypothetical protein
MRVRGRTGTDANGHASPEQRGGTDGRPISWDLLSSRRHTGGVDCRAPWMSAGEAGRLIILSGPSCMGKSPFAKALARFHPELSANLQPIVVFNSRSPRSGRNQPSVQDSDALG